PSSTAVISGKKSDGDVLWRNEIVTPRPGIVDGSLKHALGTNREGDLHGRTRAGVGVGVGVGVGRRRRRNLVTPDVANGESGLVNSDAGSKEAIAVVLGDQTQQKVLSEDHVAAEGLGFLLGEYNSLDRSLREALEHGRDGRLPPSPSSLATGSPRFGFGVEKRKRNMKMKRKRLDLGWRQQTRKGTRRGRNSERKRGGKWAMMDIMGSRSRGRSRGSLGE
ncbi:hypothetical protein PanWU01x14_074000, partial [Parasponia andersonii]